MLKHLGTFVLRLLMIFVPVMAQKSAALNSRYRKEIAEFRDRIQDAKAEGNNLLGKSAHTFCFKCIFILQKYYTKHLVQQIFLEQMDFMKRKGIKMGRQMLILCINGGVFMSNFFALKKMINANYPGFADGTEFNFVYFFIYGANLKAALCGSLILQPLIRIGYCQ